MYKKNSPEILTVFQKIGERRSKSTYDCLYRRQERSLSIWNWPRQRGFVSSET